MKFVDSEIVGTAGCDSAIHSRTSILKATSLFLAIPVLLAGVAAGQVQVPRYQSPIEAPKPQVNLPPPPPALTPDGTVVEYPIARVNDQIIDNSDYERALAQLNEEAQQRNESEAELKAQQKNLLRDMIDTQLLLSRGKELDINADTDVIRQLDEIRKQNHLDSMDALEKAVRDSGISYEDFKSNIRNRIIQQQVVQNEVGRNLRLTAKEEQAYYDAHKQEFEQPEQVSLSEILIATPDNATDAQVAQAQAKAEQVEEKLKAGANFTELAKQYSGGPNANTGGELGDFKRGQLGSKLLEDPTFALQAGQWTAPIRTRQGFIILKVTQHTPAHIPPLSQVDQQVQQAIYERDIQPALRAYLTKLREDAFIDIAPGFVDTGASPKETKIVYSGASQLPTKKKKKVEKQRLDQHRVTAVKASTPKSGASGATVQQVSATGSKKRKKIHREKIRYGQAPRTSLPDAQEQTLAPGADQGPGGAPSTLAAANAMDQSAEQATTVTDALAPAPEHTKTRYAYRSATEHKDKVAKKKKQAKEKAAMTPVAPTQQESQVEKAQAAPLGLGGDTATKKKKKKVKGAKKERLQQAPPAPPAPKPEAHPIPPKSVRENGEPVVTPAPASSTDSNNQSGDSSAPQQ